MNSITKNAVMFPSMIPLVDDFLTKDLYDRNKRNITFRGITLPPVNIMETPKDYRIEMAVPGMRKEDFRIELNSSNVLSIESDRKETKSKTTEKGTYYSNEYQYDTFSRRFSLPNTTNSEKIDAIYKDGILSVNVAKKSTPSPKAITIK